MRSMFADEKLHAFPFVTRAAGSELMDDPAADADELAEAHLHLQRLNRLFRAAGPICFGVAKLWQSAGCPAKLHVLDVGGGAGELNRQLLAWAQLQGIELRITLVDRTEAACQSAKQLFRQEPRVKVVQADLFDLGPLGPFGAGGADIATASQFAHHFSCEELPDVTAALVRASRLGAVISDLHRHWLPWLAVWLTTRLVSRNRMIRHDGPLSVAKGFRSTDWLQLQAALKQVPEAGRMTWAWRPLFRYAVLVERAELIRQGGNNDAGR